jgi:DNA sulfur modification protein DndE
MYKRLLYLVFFFALVIPCKGQSENNFKDEIKKYTKGLPFEVGNIEAPVFKDKVYDITEFGAVPDGHTLNTEAINKAITKCSEEGGGKVIIPPGYWVTGPIQMKSNVNLHVVRGALVMFSRNHSDYPIIGYPEKGFSVASPVYGVNLENIAVTGEGVLDGAGDTWRPVKKAKLTSSQWNALLKSGGYFDISSSIWYPSKEAFDGLENIKKLKGNKNISGSDYIPFRESMRPYMVMFINCKNVFLNDITIENSPKFALYPVRCSNVIFRKVKINNEWWAQNGDAMDISACRNVLIYKCTINAGDDGICMKAGGAKDLSKPVLENIVIADCIVYHAHGGFVIGSETDGGIKNISVKNCNFIGTDIGLRFKSARDRGGLVENIFVDGIYMKDMVNEAVLFDFSYEQNLEGNKNKEAKMPVFRNFNMNNIICNGAEHAFVINALEESPVKDIKISNSYFETVSGVSAAFASSIYFEKVKFKIKEDKLISLNQTDKTNFTNILFSDNVKSFISLQGDKTAMIKVSGTDLSKLVAPVLFKPEVDKKSIEIK